jgi:hypothetical protein
VLPLVPPKLLLKCVCNDSVTKESRARSPNADAQRPTNASHMMNEQSQRYNETQIATTNAPRQYKQLKEMTAFLYPRRRISFTRTSLQQTRRPTTLHWKLSSIPRPLALTSPSPQQSLHTTCHEPPGQSDLSFRVDQQYLQLD